jgi:lactoylglutathione lyase/glyoxylase I family protein
MIKALAHICILTKNLDETERFYCSGLGLTKKFNFIREGRVFGYYLQINDANFIEVFQADADSSAGEPPIKHFCLEVENIDTAIVTLRNRGIHVTDKKLGADHSWQAWLADPNGIRIELHQYTGKSSQVLGSDCVIE